MLAQHAPAPQPRQLAPISAAPTNYHRGHAQAAGQERTIQT